jgi:CheY-like chemotaxis protein
VLVDVSGDISGDIAHLLIKVEDTGIGIPEDQIDKVFQKFNQVDGSSTRKHEGTGLGLTISKMLVEKMDGEIGATSVAGEGSVFWFSIPLPVHGEQLARPNVPVDVSGARVLIIDDNEVNRAILLEQLGSWGFEASAASSGREGIAELVRSAESSRRINLVVLDYHMPGMDGAEVAAAIREHETIGRTPIVMLTSVDSTTDGSTFRHLEVQGHLVKPARSAVLMQTVIDALQGDFAGDYPDFREEADQIVEIAKSVAS